MLALISQEPGVLRTTCTNTKKRYETLLEQYCAPLSPSPADVYRASLPALSQTLNNIMGGR
jgi:hypothetical protein